MAHAKREAVFVVDAELTLIEVALALAEDNAALVKAWLDEGKLTRATIILLSVALALVLGERFLMQDDPLPAEQQVRCTLAIMLIAI